MKTAILISGEFRSGLYCFPSIKKHILDKVGDYDIYAALMLDGDAADVSVYQPKSKKFLEQPTLPEKNYIHRTGRQVYGVQGVLRQLWGLKQAYKLLEESGVAYDWVMRLRADTQFFTDIETPLSERSEGVHIPTFHNWWGYNDRFAYMPSYHAKGYFCRLDNLDEYVAQGGIFHPETHLKWTMGREGIPVYRTFVEFDTVRKDGSRFPPERYFACGDIL